MNCAPIIPTDLEMIAVPCATGADAALVVTGGDRVTLTMEGGAVALDPAQALALGEWLVTLATSGQH